MSGIEQIIKDDIKKADQPEEIPLQAVRSLLLSR